MTVTTSAPTAAGAPTDASTDPVALTTRASRRRARTAPGAAAGGRDRYLDVLRLVAMIRVVTYHTFGWAWLSLVFPSMGVMFALAGSLMARSLARPALGVIRGRMRRLLPPLWAFGIVVVLAMMVHGWAPPEHHIGHWWRRMLLWVVPIGDPPGNEWGAQATDILWYLRTYLWLVLLSPLLLKAFRLSRGLMLVLSLVPIVVMSTVWSPPDGQIGSILFDLATYVTCWLLGFAHRDGLVDRLHPAVVLLLAAATMAFGGWYGFTHQSDGSYDLNEIPLAQAFWSVGFVLLLLRFRPDMDWVRRIKPLDRTVTIFNSRAVTIYLWHEIALIVSVPLIDLMWQVRAFELSLPLDSMWFQFGVAWVLIAVAVLGVGWIEDVAAKQRPRLLP
jgi:peptidoglycan/LPS O-acetylase OafA/YrhL